MQQAVIGKSEQAAIFHEAEQKGLRLAIKGRLVALVLMGVWLVASRSGDPLRAIEYLIALGVFAGLGVIHYRIIGSSYDRNWTKYLFIALDIGFLSLLIATQPVFDHVDLPQVVIFRTPIFPFYFIILGVAAFSFSPGLVLWAGICGAAGWLGAFAYAIRDMEQTYDWQDIGTSPDTQTFMTYFFSPDFIGAWSRAQEALALVVVAILIGFVMWRARHTVRRQIEAEQERSAISDVFGQYVPPAVAEVLISKRGTLSPIEREATILFADVADFTKLTETIGPKGIVEVLNAYFDAVSQIITRHHGVITQFQGDAVLATFNVPVEDADHAGCAIRAAREINDLVHQRDFAGIHIQTRIGICTGTVIAGSVGGGGRQSYTVHGDTVNLAARLEVMNKELGTDVLISGTTTKYLAADDFRKIGQMDVRGLSEPIDLFTFATAGELNVPTGNVPATAS
ncbi:adenylate/guanylate cyclase domain-containing protein [Thalassospira xiamenensis]|uniref:Adenylate cyclase, class 3 n=1 Tax=Thalassospira xiamenensis TaxID=220697 RepID=A0A285RU24_9PROT|nr:adenylate/guanylate cyclase domain-containing protein [Thalassospira xiamenensis]SOB95882.1 Adenylate cyclase, class 3 [Thalassospira xiamenensis]